MGGTGRGLSRRSFVVAGALGIGALALRPGRTIADVLDARSPTGLWGVARTDAGLVGLWSDGRRPTVVRLSDRGPVEVERVLASPEPGVAVAVAGGGAPTVLGALEEPLGAAPPIGIDHLPASLRAELFGEVDGPLSVVHLAADRVVPRQPVARPLRGGDLDLDLGLAPVSGGIAASALRDAGVTWSAVQHPPTAEGDHCSSLTVARDGVVVLEVGDLGAAGPAALAGPGAAPVVSVADGSDRVRSWVLGSQPHELAPLSGPDAVAVHVSGGRPVALLASPAGATLLGHGPSGWEALRDVDGTAGGRRVLAVTGAAAEFLVEVDGGVRSVDGEGRLR